MGLKKFALDPVVVIFFKKSKKNHKCWIKCISKKITTTGSRANFAKCWIRPPLAIFLIYFEKNYNDWIKSKLFKSQTKWTGLIRTCVH